MLYIKVRCINAKDYDFLIEGKEYNVKCNGKTTYILEGSPMRDGLPIKYRKERFIDTT